MIKLRVVVCCVITASLLIASLQASRRQSHDSHDPLTLPVAADGSISPDSIPDHVAYRHFVLMAATTEVPSRIAADRFELLLGEIGLAAHDRALLRDIVAGLREQIDELDAQAAGLSARDPTLLNLRDERTSLLDATANTIREKLTDVGNSQLDQFIQALKREIKIYGAVR